MIKKYPTSAIRQVPASIARPPYAGDMGREIYDGDEVQPPDVIERMRTAGTIAHNAMMVAAAEVAPGVSTDHLDAVAHEYMCDHQAYPASLHYRGFPKSICTSVNEVVCHGIPDARPLEEGDIVKIDVTAYWNGVHGDNCGTFFVGEVDEASRLLSERTQEAMRRGIRAAKPGRQVNTIGRVIESYAKRFGYGDVAEYTGHGCHVAFHSGLIIPHVDDPMFDAVIRPGMTFTVEPMLTIGSARTEVWDDGWTVVTKDRSRCAQWEQTILITDAGAEILTAA